MEHQYLGLLRDVLDNGIQKSDRTGTGTLSVFGRMYRHDLNDGFPLLTTKKIHVRSVIHELLWFLAGDTNTRYLKENGVSIWDEWADSEGNLGPVYGAQFRSWKDSKGIIHDQVAKLINGIRQRPDSRRHIINLWNVADLPDESVSPLQNVAEGRMALAPCPIMWQFYLADGKLSCMLTQRSGDLFLGVPFNGSSLALFTHMVAQQCDVEVGCIVHSIGDLHLYRGHESQAHTQLLREPRPLPRLRIKRRPPSIFDYKFEDFEILGYDPHPHIPAPIAI